MKNIDKLIRNLIEQEPSICFVLEDAPNHPIVPVILDKDCTTVAKNIGKLEYQVSDDMPGKRNESIDVYSWAEAKKVAVDWENAEK